MGCFCFFFRCEHLRHSVVNNKKLYGTHSVNIIQKNVDGITVVNKKVDVMKQKP